MNEREDLKAYLDGELPEPRAEEVRLALERDPDLREEYTFMKLLTKEIKDTSTEPEVKGVDSARAAARRRPWFLRPPALIVQGIAALFVIGLVGSAVFPVYGQSKEAAKVAQNKFDAKRILGEQAGELEVSPKADSEAAKAPTGVFNGSAADTPAQMETGKEDLASSNNGMPAESAKAKSANGFAGGSFKDRADEGIQAKPAAPSSTSPVIPGMPRDVVKNGNLGVKVKDTKKAMQEVTDTVKAMSGYVESSSVGGEALSMSGHMTIRVPAINFETLVNSVRRMGEVMVESLNGQDVTAPLADMQARTKVLKAEEQSYIEMLRQTRRLQDVLDLRDRLSNVRQQIESIEAQRHALAQTAALSTLNIDFTQQPVEVKTEPKDWYSETTNSATKTLGEVGQTIISGALYVAILSPIWAPIALIAWWASRRRKTA